MAINPLALLGLASAAFPWPHLGVLERDQGTSILERALKSQRKVDYLRIENRRGSEGAATWQVKVQTSVEKGIMVTILKPSYQAGLVTIDDTKQMTRYFRDSKVVITQPSPFQLQPAFDFRWKLIQQNYKVSLGAQSELAGEDVQELVIRPVHEQVPVRRMYVDTKHAVVLRYTVDTDDEDESVIFDTLFVQFGKVAAEAGFGLPDEAAKARKMTFDGPKKIVSPSDSKADAGFSTRMPAKLPLGFRLSGAYLFSSRGRSYVEAKITDGMVTLTVYQWKPENARDPVDAKLVQNDPYGVKFGIAYSPGDAMPEEVLQRLVEAFCKSSE